MRSILAKAAVAIGLAAGPHAFAQEDVDAQLQEGRRLLHGSRLAASDKLQRQGSLSQAELKAATAMSSDAMKIWISCVISKVNQTPSTADPEVGADRAMAACRGDREEFAAWLRFTGQAHRDEIPEQKLAVLLKEQEADNRARALARLRQR